MQKKIKILHLEDQPNDAFLISREIQKGKIEHESLVVDTREKFETALSEFCPDLILSDHSLPSFNSIHALALFQKSGLEVPFILITAAMSDEFAVDMIKKGVDDYILKDRLNRLPSAIQNSLEKFRHRKEEKQFLAELLKREKRYKALVENSADAVIILNLLGSPSYVSPSVKHVLGYSEAECMELDLSQLIHKEDACLWISALKRAALSSAVPVQEAAVRMKHQNGSWQWIEHVLTNKEEDPDINGTIINFRNITERKLNEARIKQSNRLYAFISEINQAIVHASDEKILFKNSCRIAVETGKFQGAWIGEIDQEKQRITMLESSGAEAEKKDQVDHVTYDEAGPQGLVLDSGTYFVSNDIASDTLLTKWKQVAAVSGYNSCIVLPLKKSGGVIGTYNLYSREKNIFNSEEIALLEGVTEDISFAIDVFRKEQLRQMVEEQLEKKRNKLKRAQEIGHLGTWDLDFFTGIAAWSEEALRIYGLPTNALFHPYESWISFIHQDDLLLSTSLMKKVREEKSNQSFFYRIVRKDGNVRHIYAQMQFTTDKNGKAAGINGIIQDVTQIREAEQQLKESEKFNHGILSSLHAHIAVIDKDGVIVAVNKAWDEFARENGTIDLQSTSRGSNYFEVCHHSMRSGDDLAGRALEGIKSVLDKKKFRFEMEYPCHAPDKKRWFLLSAMSFGTDENKVVVSHQDITEIKESQAALRISQANLQAIFENSSQGFMLTDLNGNIIAHNQKIVELIKENLGKEVRLGEYITFFIEESRRKNFQGVLENVFSGKTVKYDHSYINILNEITWFNFKINPVTNSGRVEGICVTVEDVTERKITEQLLQRSESNLYAIIENTDSFIYSLDREFRYITFNTALQKSVSESYGIHIYPGLNIFELIRKMGKEQEEEWYSHYSRALLGETVKFEKEFEVNGTRTFTSFSVHPIVESDVIIGLSCFVNDITKQKLSEEENKFKANLLNTIGQAAVATDLDGKVNYWNKAAEEIYGWSKEEAVGRNILELTPADTTKEQAEQIMKSLKQGRTWDGEFRVKRKDGTEFPAYVTDSPIYNQEGKLAGIIGISTDISEKKALEQLLDKATLLSRIGSYEIDVAKDAVYWSAMTREIYEVDENFVPKLNTALDFCMEDSSRTSLSRAYWNAIETNVPFEMELRILTSKGNERWIRILGETETKDGKCLRVYGSIQDIDKVKRAELEVLKVYEEKNTILESIGDAFFAVDKNWVVNYWNKEAAKMLDKPKEKILNKNLWDIFPERLGSEAYNKYLHALNTSQVVQFETYQPALAKWFEINAYPSPGGLSVFFKDISERKESESRLNDLNKNLQSYANELLMSNKGLEQFSYIISHNLRSPVANIIGLSQQLSVVSHSPETKNLLLKELTSNVKRLDTVIQDLNAILQVKSHINELKETVVFSKLIEDVQESIFNIVRESNVEIEAKNLEVNEFFTLKSYIYSIFYNLISNSIKYRRQEVKPHIEISSERKEGKLVLCFKDNGKGIDLEKQKDHVFGLYKRFHSNIEGKGMGLFMVKTQVEVLGGKIYIESEVEKGTTFILEFEQT